jgi:beta-xylosidase
MSRSLAIALVSLSVASLFAGCLGSETKITTPGLTASGGCNVSIANAAIPGWTVHRGSWAKLASAEGHADVVCGAASEALSSLVHEQGEFTDFEAEVSFNMQEGDSGAGLVIHYEDDQNYNIVRYSPREQGWHIFTVIAGNRQKRDAGSITPPTTNPELDQWVALRVESRDGRVEAWDGSTKVIDYTLADGASHEGRIGYFLRDAGMVALFDDFQAFALGPNPSDACAAATATSQVPGWTKHGGNWTTAAETEGHTEVVCGEATQALSVLVRDQGSFTNVEAKVSFNMQEGDSGAGLVIHYEDDRNYNIVRYSPREQGWHIFTVIAGNRQKQDAGSVSPPTTNPEPGEWVELLVESTNGHVQAWHGSTKVIDYTLQAEASHSGKVGYFLRDTGMSALFADFQASRL